MKVEEQILASCPKSSKFTRAQVLANCPGVKALEFIYAFQRLEAQGRIIWAGNIRGEPAYRVHHARS